MRLPSISFARSCLAAVLVAGCGSAPMPPPPSDRVPDLGAVAPLDLGPGSRGDGRDLALPGPPPDLGPCQPESDLRFCGRLAKNCDTVSGFDNCGRHRTISCGTCMAPQTCGDKVPNVCGPQAWTKVTTTTMNDFTGVWSGGPDDVWAVSDVSSNDGETLWHYDGMIWNREQSPSKDNLLGIWGDADDDLWIVGSDGVFHKDAAAWTRAYLGTISSFTSVWGLAGGPVFVLGTDQAGQPVVLAWRNGSWSALPALPQLTKTWASALWASSPTDVWLGTSGSGITGDLYRYDGASWQRQTTTYEGGPQTISPNNWVAIGGTGTGDMWGVVEGGVLHWDGSTWHMMAQAGATSNGGWPWGNGLFVFAKNDAWVVGNTLWHWVGVDNFWKTTDVGPPTTAAVWGSHPWDVWAVGASGAVWHWH